MVVETHNHHLGSRVAKSQPTDWVLKSILVTYRKIPNVSPGLIEVFKHFLEGLYSEGLTFGGGLYSEGILC